MSKSGNLKQTFAKMKFFVRVDGVGDIGHWRQAKIGSAVLLGPVLCRMADLMFLLEHRNDSAYLPTNPSLSQFFMTVLGYECKMSDP